MSCSNIVDHFDYIRQQHPFKDDVHLSIDVKTNKKALYLLIKSCFNLSVTFFSAFSFGGGPAVNHLYMCAICQVEIEALAKRRKTEIDTFIKVNVCVMQKFNFVLKCLCVE